MTLKELYDAYVVGVKNLKIKNPADYAEMYNLGRRTTKILIDLFQKLETGEIMTLAEAEEYIRPLLEIHGRSISDAAQKVQETLNKKSGVTLKAQAAAVSRDRIDGIIKHATSGPIEQVGWVLDSGVMDFALSIIDDTCRTNAEAQYRAGLKPIVRRRIISETCAWCRQWEGAWSYPDLPRQVFQRHRGCDCQVEYINGQLKQNVHTKKWEKLQLSELVKGGESLSSRQAADYEKYLKAKNREAAIEQLAFSRGITYEKAQKEYRLQKERERDRERYRRNRAMKK